MYSLPLGFLFWTTWCGTSTVRLLFYLSSSVYFIIFFVAFCIAVHSKSMGISFTKLNWENFAM